MRVCLGARFTVLAFKHTFCFLNLSSIAFLLSTDVLDDTFSGSSLISDFVSLTAIHSADILVLLSITESSLGAVLLELFSFCSLIEPKRTPLVDNLLIILEDVELRLNCSL